MGIGFYGYPPQPPKGLPEPPQGPPLTGIMPGPPMGLPEPPDTGPVDTEPWIDSVIPQEGELRPPPEPPPVVVVEPVIVPPVIVPPPPDITPETIVPPVYEDPIPEPMPVPPQGVVPIVQPPASIIVVAGLAPVGTFMVYLGKRLLLSMAASIGQQLGASAGAMLVGPLGKQISRGVRLRYHTGVSPGALGQIVPQTSSAVSYAQAWRMVPQEFSYWEA